jgi:hypothetical protein
MERANPGARHSQDSREESFCFFDILNVKTDMLDARKG